MSCFKKKYKKNIVHSTPFKEERVDGVFVDKMLKEALVCGGCHKAFSLRSNKIKIHSTPYQVEVRTRVAKMAKYAHPYQVR